MTIEYSAVARAVLLLTICQSCIPLAGLRQRCRLVIPPILQRVRAIGRRLDSYVARDRALHTNRVRVRWRGRTER